MLFCQIGVLSQDLHNQSIWKIIVFVIILIVNFLTEMGGSEEGDSSMPDISGDRSLRDRDYNPEQVIIIIKKNHIWNF